jgi:proteasome lid subunit RPN8/RPN11
VLTLTDATWKQMLAMLATSPDGVERVAYLDGIRTGDGTSLGIGIVTTVTVPHAVQSAGHFTVSAQEMSRAGAHLRHHGLVRLAQVHTHPGHDTRHSPIDDESAYSRKAGTVHVHDSRGWHQLSQSDAEAFIRVIPATVDTRPTRFDAPAWRPRPGSSPGWRRWGPWATIWAHVTRRL